MKRTSLFASTLVLFVSVVCAACVTPLTSGGERVNVGKSAPHSNCRELGIVMGSGRGGSAASSQDKLESAMNELRNATAAHGGDFVVMDVSAGDAHGIAMSGRAFDCSRGAPQTEPVQVVQSTTPGAPPSIEDRLKKLADLRDKGVITPEEYTKRREEIIRDL